jgi:hypothetical protein
MNADYSLNQTAYHGYSPVFLSTTSVLSYGLGFAAVASIIVHTALYHRREILYGLLTTIGKLSGEERPDIHARVSITIPSDRWPLTKAVDEEVQASSDMVVWLHLSGHIQHQRRFSLCL